MGNVIKTGFKFLAVTIIAGMITSAILFLLGLVGISIDTIKTGTTSFAIILIVGILYLISIVAINGYLAEKFWDWD